MVTTPVPPTPETRMEKGCAPMAGNAGSGGAASALDDCRSRALALRGFAPCTVTKDGQKPLTQEKSLLHEDWSILRLRPNSVSSGCTETQFDFTPQSPQPSQTSSLMMTR